MVYAVLFVCSCVNISVRVSVFCNWLCVAVPLFVLFSLGERGCCCCCCVYNVCGRFILYVCLNMCACFFVPALLCVDCFGCLLGLVCVSLVCFGLCVVCFVGVVCYVLLFGLCFFVCALLFCVRLFVALLFCVCSLLCAVFVYVCGCVSRLSATSVCSCF